MVVLPPLLLAIVGLTHPHELTDDTAAAWRHLHIILLPVFPLLGLAPWLVLRSHSQVPSWAAALLGYVYAACYTALDVLAGIGAGALQLDNAGNGREVMFAEGNDLAFYGVVAYLAATVLASVVLLRRTGLAALPGAALAVFGAWLFLDNHIYWPLGGISMLTLAAGWGALAWAGTREPEPAPAAESTARA
ncbi:hypothetical protein BH20ACT5_BH20ACT5_17270 [soil metagenome]